MLTSKRQASAEIEITPEMVTAFSELFDRWRYLGSNAAILLEGGQGDLAALASLALAWAQDQKLAH